MDGTSRFILVPYMGQCLSFLMMDIDPEILNAAFELVTEWGENFRKPIVERMQNRFPSLTEKEIADAEAVAKEAEYYIYSLGEKELAGEISETQITTLAMEKYPWLESRHAARLSNISMYYARR